MKRWMRWGGVVLWAGNGLPDSPAPSQVMYYSGAALYKHRDEVRFVHLIRPMWDHDRLDRPAAETTEADREAAGRPFLKRSHQQIVAMGDRACHWLRDQPPSDEKANTIAAQYCDPVLTGQQIGPSLQFTIAERAWSTLCWPARATHTGGHGGD